MAVKRHEITIPESIDVGGYTWKIETTELAKRELDGLSAWGKVSNDDRKILFDYGMAQQQANNSFLHEILHVVDYVFNNKTLDEKATSAIANGLHQVFNQLGISFKLVKK